jgi:hypothetical protein
MINENALAEEILDYIPPWRTDHVVYFNPADQDFPIGFNLLHAVPKERRHLVRSGVVSAFKNICPLTLTRSNTRAGSLRQSMTLRLCGRRVPVQSQECGRVFESWLQGVNALSEKCQREQPLISH